MLGVEWRELRVEFICYSRERGNLYFGYHHADSGIPVFHALPKGFAGCSTVMKFSWNQLSILNSHHSTYTPSRFVKLTSFVNQILPPPQAVEDK